MIFLKMFVEIAQAIDNDFETFVSNNFDNLKEITDKYKI